jgi:predicted lipid carrier protein YhbT
MPTAALQTLPFDLSRPLAWLAERLPAQPPALAFAALLNAFAWPLLKRHDVHPMTGKRYGVHVSDLGLRVHFTLTREGFAARTQGADDLTIRASSRDLALLVTRRVDPDTLFFNRRLVMEGDTELGLHVKNTLDAIELDEWLALLPPLAAGLLRTWVAREG